MKNHIPILIVIFISRVSPLAAQSAKTVYTHGSSTVYEQLMLEMINRARANPSAEAARLGIGLNDGLPAGTISLSPKPPLTCHPLLTDAARAHTRWMMNNNTFSHTGVNGSDAGSRMTAAGYTFSGSWSWGENISWGGTSGTPNVLTETIARHDGLFRSPGHRQNLCNPSFRDVGLGVLDGRYSGWNAVMATQKFAYSGAYPSPMLLGVVFDDRDRDGFYDPGEGVANVTVEPAAGSWKAITSSSGGYAVPYTGPSAAMTVTFSGGPLQRPVERSVVRTGGNIKLDLSSVVFPFVEIVPDSSSYSAANGFRLQVSGTGSTIFQLQYSTDLRTWQTVGTHTMGSNAMSLTHRPSTEPGFGFYKVIWQP